MAIIYIDNKPYEAKQGKNVLETCLTLGFDLPYFCWHPAMGSIGACRQCAVKVFKDESDTNGKIMMSCMEPVKDNLRISINDPVAKAFRAQVIEWLMTNHPHDCAVCDEGGSCHLQDMTVMSGHNYRRFRFKKRTHRNQNLGPFINHEMNRCIQCYRCVRFYKVYAGGKDLDVFAAHDHLYFGREKDGTLENEFSGNLAEVCPTGVFTDKTLKEHYTRKWDMTMAPSVCQHCSLGCNIIVGERYGKVRQITSRYNGEVNGYFICDRGRFGYEFVNSMNRIQNPLVRSEVPEVVEKHQLYRHLQAALSNNKKTIGIGSPRASLESNFALMQLVGKDNFYQGISELEAQLLRTILEVVNSGNVHIPSIKETEQADAVLILGEDPPNSAPRLALSLRQAVRKAPLEQAMELNLPIWNDAALRERIQQEKGDLFIAYPVKTKLDEIAAATFNNTPDEIARLGYAIASFLDDNSPKPEDIEDHIWLLSQQIGESLRGAKNPLIVTGTSTHNESILKAASNIAYALTTNGRKASLSFIVPETNSMGLAMMGAPSLENATEVLKSLGAETVVVLENDLYRRDNKEQVDLFFNLCKNLIVLDHLNNRTSQKADILIPVSTFAEGDGTLVNNEGRAQRFFQVYAPKNENIRESWRWLDEFLQIKNGVRSSEFVVPDDIMVDLVQAMPQFKGAETVAPPNNFRIAGQKIPRQPHRYSGRTAMQANVNVNEPKPPEDTDSALSFTMEGFRGIPPAPLIPFFWAPGWNSQQSINKYQIEVGGPLHGGDPGRRLFTEEQKHRTEYLNTIPPRSQRYSTGYLSVPLPHIFGSDELSMYSPGVQERAPKPYIALSLADASELNVSEGEVLHLVIGESNYDLVVQIKDELKPGMVGVPFNLPEMMGIHRSSFGMLKGVLKMEDGSRK